MGWGRVGKEGGREIGARVQKNRSDAMERERRVNKEIKDFEKPDTSGSDIVVKQIPGEKFHLKGHLKGPADTPYEGGAFVVDIVLPNE